MNDSMPVFLKIEAPIDFYIFVFSAVTLLIAFFMFNILKKKVFKNIVITNAKVQFLTTLIISASITFLLFMTYLFITD